jgi:hypothetical protein
MQLARGLSMLAFSPPSRLRSPGPWADGVSLTSEQVSVDFQRFFADSEFWLYVTVRPAG